MGLGVVVLQNGQRHKQHDARDNKQRAMREKSREVQVHSRGPGALRAEHGEPFPNGLGSTREPPARSNSKSTNTQQRLQLSCMTLFAS